MLLRAVIASTQQIYVINGHSGKGKGGPSKEGRVPVWVAESFIQPLKCLCISILLKAFSCETQKGRICLLLRKGNKTWCCIQKCTKCSIMLTDWICFLAISPYWNSTTKTNSRSGQRILIWTPLFFPGSSSPCGIAIKLPSPVIQPPSAPFVQHQ